MTITVFGSINIDLTTYSERLPKSGETLHGQRYAIGLGGKGCNQAVAINALGAKANLVGRIGNDEFGNNAQKLLSKFGVNTASVHVDPSDATGIAVISVDAQAENSITVIGGANMAVDQSDVTRHKIVFEQTKVLLLQMEIPLLAALSAADIVRSNNGVVVLDPAPAPPDGLDPAILKRIDIITPNETETEALCGIKPKDANQAAQAATLLRAQGVKIAIIKLGSKGVYYQSETEDGFVSAFKVDSIDTVAAGDCFNGGLAYQLSLGASLGKAVEFAAACGALSTTKAGAAESAPSLSDVLELTSSV
jgi:ribokinase